jgi:hypothetical protein
MSFEDNFNSNFTEYFKSGELSIIDKLIPVFLNLWIYLNIGFTVYTTPYFDRKRMKNPLICFLNKNIKRK